MGHAAMFVVPQDFAFIVICHISPLLMYAVNVGTHSYLKGLSTVGPRKTVWMLTW
jgi:hypothetical protein